ncbi:MAG TPA: GNAT family N-acetyltransferase [Longimicrobium sp.]|nr:GNAT family N-acetyltransferase [Longimicrobium sp.]
MTVSTPEVSATAPRVREVPRGGSLAPFLDVAWKINAADPMWVPPLRMVVGNALNRDKHPFHLHADVAYFIAERGGAAVGRIAAIVNHRHNEFHEDRVGFFGMFECVDDASVARLLVDTAADWVRARGMDTLRGPMNLSTNEEVSSPGVLVEGFDTPPSITMSHNPPYYARLLEGCGLVGSKDLLAYWMPSSVAPERLVRVVERTSKRDGVTLRPLRMKKLNEEVRIIHEIYNSAWSRNWGFVPMTSEEFTNLAKDMKSVVDPELCLIAEIGGEPVGFSLALPDLNHALKHIPDGRLFPFGVFKLLWHRRKVHSLRLITLGLKPEYQTSGMGAAMYLRTFQVGARKGFHTAEASWILDDNHLMRQALEKLDFVVYKRYRIFDRAL